MIIPIGHEEDSVRRLPWITFGVMGLCVAAFALSGQLDQSPLRGQEAARRAVEAIEYFFEHPYLELDPKLADLAFEDTGPEEREALIEAYRGQVPRPSDATTLRAEQRRLEELIAEIHTSLGLGFYERWGLVPARPSPVAFLTHMFLHGGLLHLVGNLLILYLAAPFIEDVWGRPLFAGFYLVAGLAAAVAFIAFNPGSTIPMIGASGAIAGVMGAFLIRYWNTRIRFLYMFSLLWRGTFTAPAWVILPMWFGEQLFMATVTTGTEGGGIAYWAHVGGFAFGASAAAGMRRWRIEERFLEPALAGKLSTTILDNPQVERALQAAAAGNTNHALVVLRAQLERGPHNPDVALAYWGVAVEARRAPEAAPAMLEVIRDELRRGATALACGHWTELVGHLPEAQADPDLLIRLARALTREERHEEAKAALRRAMLSGGSEMPSATALRIARAARELDACLARGAAKVALARPDLSPAERHEAEQMLARA
jgi:membrane associated rhomboid family serine protease